MDHGTLTGLRAITHVERTKLQLDQRQKAVVEFWFKPLGPGYSRTLTVSASKHILENLFMYVVSYSNSMMAGGEVGMYLSCTTCSSCQGADLYSLYLRHRTPQEQ
eukprot:3866409-Amphidinium_carterae.1